MAPLLAITDCLSRGAVICVSAGLSRHGRRLVALWLQPVQVHGFLAVAEPASLSATVFIEVLIERPPQRSSERGCYGSPDAVGEIARTMRDPW
jgi:hypothetical protein